MEKLSGLISKKVISLQEGKLCGYVLDLVFEEKLKTFNGFVVVDDETENTFFLDRRDVLSQGEDCLMIDSDQCLVFDVYEERNNPIGKNVYDTKGVFLGKVLDVCVSGKNVKKIITNKCEIPQNYIQKLGVDFIIFGLTKNKKIKKNNLPSFKNKEKLNKIQEKMPKISIFSQINDNNQILSAKKQIINEDSQIRIFINSSALLGKQVVSDLFGMNNEIIAKKNQIINKKILDEAKKHNKLNLLNYFSK